MSKIARYQGNVRAFASDAQGMERTVFGGTNQADDLTSQITASFLRGWGIVGASEHPSLEDFNAAMYAMSQFIAYQHQMGVPEWHAEQEYHIGSICTHNGESYQSLQNANIGSQPPSAKWTPVLTSKNGLANLGLTNPNGRVGRMLAAPKIFTSSGIYTPTPGAKSIFVEVQGAGGAGGNATNGTGTATSSGSGGGAGGYASSWLDIVPASASVVVGAGGSGGGAGGNSSFNATIMATGGSAGASNVVNGGNSYSGHARGGLGGTSSGGTINGSGGAGFPALITQGIPSGGNGGASHFSGNTLSAGAAGGQGLDGLLGSGGSGGAQVIGGGGYGGGKGGDGIVIVWEYA